MALKPRFADVSLEPLGYGEGDYIQVRINPTKKQADAFRREYARSALDVAQRTAPTEAEVKAAAANKKGGKQKAIEGVTKEKVAEMLEKIDAGDPDSIVEACGELQAAYKKCDGLKSPKDFVSGDAREQLAGMILDLIEELGCE